ncbi:LLM class F420-dependent oxidoreductase [Amycolatopsis acidicola]|uniref:LLM class F420-dependent oxidoreductase n=1 Tax=Amycolatopsis acidicola TaxID=2596893 RepID=A0A5N0UZL0_9PSEU|nr:LLM class F420-dependent oxidoreductase [Amycolatopsis acidicola]KAA9156742.1 LLM class F420-dependent oxidoreductase [Amycolatopsis acidicola]
MERSVVFPSQELPADRDVVTAFAQAAEELGYSRVIVYDHVLGAVQEERTPALAASYDETVPFHEPLTLLAFLAAVTSRIELATGVLVAPQRQTALLAKQATEIDGLSGGRLALGVGAGWNHVEFEALGMGFTDRGARLEEQIEVLRRLWSEPVVNFDGRHHRIDRAGLVPRPVRRIPVLMGGRSMAAVRRAARLADGFLFAFGGEETFQQAEELHAAVQQAGRDTAEVPMEMYVSYGVGPDAWAADLARWRKTGGTRMAVRTSTASAAAIGQKVRPLDDVDDHIAAIAEFAAWWDGAVS